MSFSDRLVLWLHIAAAIFSIGPVTGAIMSTPRFIRKRDISVLGFLAQLTRIYTIVSLLVLVLGIVLADMRNDFSKPWISISMTLFVVALVLLLLIMRDQRKALTALRQDSAALAGQRPAAVQSDASGTGGADGETKPGDAEPAKGAAAGSGVPASGGRHIAAVESGRIASLGGVTAIIWLVILVLMVWK